MKNVPAFVPDSESLKTFNKFCKLIFEKQRILEAESARLAALRDSLLPRLMSGELDISEVQL